MKANYFLLSFVSLLLTHVIAAQGRLVLNGGIITVSNGAFLVVDNPATNAITRNSGHIVSEGENNRIKWNIGTTVGSYNVPFGYSGSYIPVSFTKTSGSGSGVMVFSTYHTSWKNSDHLPAGIPNMTGGIPDHSPWAIDRFWQVSAQNYTSKPALSNLMFTYVDAEHQASGNNIIEPYLSAQQYNEADIGWGGVQPGGLINTTANTVTVASVPSTAFFKWWTLTDQLYPLALNRLEFTAGLAEGKVVLQWKVYNEKLGTTYQLQRRKEGGTFETIAVVNGVATPAEKTYHHNDLVPYSGRSFYRVLTKENGGAMFHSPERSVRLQENKEMIIFPNPVVYRKLVLHLSSALQGAGILVIYNQAGHRVASYSIAAKQEKIQVDLPSNLPAGTYICLWQSATGKAQQTFVLY